MTEYPVARRPHWPDAMAKVSADSSEGLKNWAWAEERLVKSHNYWIATSRKGGVPHLMVVWGIWWEGAFWCTTGPRTRKAKNVAALPQCVIGTEKADEAVILEGAVEEIRDRDTWKSLAIIYDQKYGGELYPLLESCGGNVYRVNPLVAFGQDEHAEDFVNATTKWTFAT